MEDYEIAGIAVFRYIEPRFINVKDEDIKKLYEIWCMQESAASWLWVTNRNAEMFCRWAFTPPVEGYLKSSDQQ